MDAPQTVTPDKLPDPWLLDSEYLLRELTRVRELCPNDPRKREKLWPDQQRN